MVVKSFVTLGPGWANFSTVDAVVWVRPSIFSHRQNGPAYLNDDHQPDLVVVEVDPGLSVNRFLHPHFAGHRING